MVNAKNKMQHLSNIYSIFFIFLFLVTDVYSGTRTNNLPSGFIWRYQPDEIEPTPRTGQFWRSGIILEDKVIALNTYHLTALDFSGKVLWTKGLQAENPYSEAKIHLVSSNEIIVIITDALLLINTDTGELIDHYGYNVNKRSIFQFTELLPRQSIFFNDHIYVFLGPELISFHRQTLARSAVATFNSQPKTIPLLYNNKFLLSFHNGAIELFDPLSLKKETIRYGVSSDQFSIRQPVVQDQLIYIPSNKDIKVYSNMDLFAESDTFFDTILDTLDDTVWLRQHKKGTLYQIDQTLKPSKSVVFISDKYANKINTPLVGNSNIIINIDGIEGQLFIIQRNPLTLKKTLYSEDFADSPPLQNLSYKNNKLLLGAFHALYMIDIDNL